jgi:hypothetical protein
LHDTNPHYNPLVVKNRLDVQILLDDIQNEAAKRQKNILPVPLNQRMTMGLKCNE